MDPTGSAAGGSPASRAQSRYDQLLKWMLTRAHDDFLALVAPDLTWRGERSPEVPAVPRYADLVWEVERPGSGQESGPGLLHVELQLKVEADIGERLAEYAIRLWRRDHLPVRSLVVYLRKSPSVPTPPFVIPGYGGDQQQPASLEYHYGVVRLWEIPQERVLEMPEYGLWPLASLMAGTSVESTVSIAERLAALPAPERERSDLIGLLANLAGINIPHDILLAAFRSKPMIDDLLEYSSVAQAFFEEGEREGKREGERQMARRMALLALEGRFGPLSDELRAAIDAADEAALQEIVAHIATESLDQVRARLGL
ncbi:MAG TPA: hypothetical protein VF116_23650 [Ktedonobacterales bacterium]